jgi:hypothetical protein
MSGEHLSIRAKARHLAATRLVRHRETGHRTCKQCFAIGYAAVRTCLVDQPSAPATSSASCSRLLFPFFITLPSSANCYQLIFSTFSCRIVSIFKWRPDHYWADPSKSPCSASQTTANNVPSSSAFLNYLSEGLGDLISYYGYKQLLCSADTKLHSDSESQAHHLIVTSSVPLRPNSSDRPQFP